MEPTNVCRLCLNSSAESFQDVKSIDPKHLEIVLPEIDFTTTTSSLLCPNCTELLRTSYLFKTNCLETERLMKSYMDRTGNNTNISLSDVLKSNIFNKDVKSENVVKLEGGEDMEENFFDNYSDNDDNTVDNPDDKKEFSCPICHIIFVDEHSFKRHQHIGSFRCGICNVGFSAANTLTQHMSRHKANYCDSIDKMMFSEMQEAIRKHSEIYPDEISELNRVLLCEICRETFDTKDNLFEHIQSHFRVQCNFCSRYFKDSKSLEGHIDKEHHSESKSFDCDLCFRRYRSRTYLLTHLRTHFERPRCKSCNRTYYNVSCLRRHIGIVHKPKGNDEELDGIEFEVDEEAMMATIKKHLEKYRSKEDSKDVDSKEFNCEICNKICTEGINSDDHMKSHFLRPKCTSCDKSYFNMTCLKRHLTDDHKNEIPPTEEVIKSEYLDDPISCPNCNQTTCTCNDNNRNLKCNICNKVMGNRSSFLRHKLIHSKRKNFICDFCQKAFVTKLYLQRHITTTHLGMTRKRTSNHIFTCDTCGLTTNNKHTLIQHMRTHTGERPYKCDICGKTFVQSSTLGTHKRTVHLNERRFTCEYCSKSFNTKGSLTKHILEVHMVDKIEKKFICNFCGKKYRLQSQLTCHLKWHSAERKFSCDICGKPFVDRHSVKKHRVIHFSEKQHKCEICGKGFHQKYNIKIHMKVHSRIP